MTAVPPPPAFDPDEVRRLADEILAGEEYRPPDRSYLERALDWIARQLERLFGGDSPTGGEPGAAGAGGSSWFTLLLLVLGIVLVVVLVRSLRGTWRRRRPAGDDDVDVDLDDRRSAQAWDDLARQLEAEGRWKEGLRARFGALVERLVDGGLVAPLPGRTSGEYRVDVRTSIPEAGDAFAAAAELFDRAWYGDEPTGPDEAARFTTDAERVLVAAGRERDPA